MAGVEWKSPVRGGCHGAVKRAASHGDSLWTAAPQTPLCLSHGPQKHATSTGDANPVDCGGNDAAFTQASIGANPANSKRNIQRPLWTAAAATPLSIHATDLCAPRIPARTLRVGCHGPAAFISQKRLAGDLARVRHGGRAQHASAGLPRPHGRGSFPCDWECDSSTCTCPRCPVMTYLSPVVGCSVRVRPPSDPGSWNVTCDGRQIWCVRL